MRLLSNIAWILYYSFYEWSVHALPYVIHYYTKTYPSSIKNVGENIFRFITSIIPGCGNIQMQYQRKQRNHFIRGFIFVQESMLSFIHLWVYHDIACHQKHYLLSSLFSSITDWWIANNDTKLAFFPSS